VPRIAGVLLLAGFVWREDRTRVPLLPLGIFRLRTLTAANGVAVLVSMIMGGLSGQAYTGRI
jgi:hypothetical protein